MTNLAFVNLEEESVEVELFNQTEAGLSALRKKYTKFPDPSESPENYEVVKAGVKELTSLRTSLEAKRKEIKQPYLDAGKIIDSKAKQITAELVKLEEPMKAAKKKVDDKEKREKEERIARLNKRIDEIRQHQAMARGQDSESIAQLIETVEAIECEDFYELRGEAIQARADTLEYLGNAYSERLNFERSEREAREAREDADEARRKQAIQDRINKCRMIPLELMGHSSAVIEAKINQVQQMDVSEANFGEFSQEAKTAVAETVKKLTAMASQQKQMEAMQEQQKAAEEVKPADPEPEKKPEPLLTGVDMAEPGGDRHAEQVVSQNSDYVEPCEVATYQWLEQFFGESGMVTGMDMEDITAELVECIKAGNVPHVMWTGENS